MCDFSVMFYANQYTQIEHRTDYREKPYYFALEQSAARHFHSHEWREAIERFSAVAVIYTSEVLSSPNPFVSPTVLRKHAVHMVNTYWPNFSLWNFVPILLDYQGKVWAR
ncbi:uncharacterized protein F5147DRAFT_404255 [Suillus discolor]|uniref:Uncharacterized protein n=1 Tax=Suillus discolor TaxID=1912936 RepID=A0A9P7EXU2_9AGAM|nr:uncharacterized protein F5147DRAFT_404255 [Suillus discolor]KAG2095130.1 hypothetical protein F5147DRAFT_404255 [Suillus discolor]